MRDPMDQTWKCAAPECDDAATMRVSIPPAERFVPLRDGAVIRVDRFLCKTHCGEAISAPCPEWFQTMVEDAQATMRGSA